MNTAERLKNFTSRQKIEAISKSVNFNVIRDFTHAAFIKAKFPVAKLYAGHDPIAVSFSSGLITVKVISKNVKKLTHKQYMRILAYMRQYFVLKNATISSLKENSALTLEFSISDLKDKYRKKK